MRFLPSLVVRTSASNPPTFALLPLYSSVSTTHFQYPYGSAGTLLSRPSEVYIPAHGVYRTSGTDL